MRKLLIGAVVVIVLALGALAAAPRFVDPGAYRDLVTASLRRATGRDIAIDGPLDLTLLPTPSLTAHDVRVPNPPGMARPDLLRIGGLELRLAVAPLLTGRIVLQSVTMADPELDIERLPDGRLNLDGAMQAGDRGAGSRGAGSGASREATPLGVERVDITNGRLSYRAGATAWHLDRLDMTARLAGMGGPARAEGTLQMAKTRLGFALETGAPGDHLPIDLKLDLLGTGATAELGGDLAMAKGRPSLTGTAKLSGPDLAAFLRSFGGTAPAVLGRAFSARADIAAEAGGVWLDHMALSFDETHGSGTLAIAEGTPTRFTLGLKLGQVDLDRLAAAAAPLRAGPRDRLPLATAFKLPDALQGSLDIAADGAVWRGGILRELRLQATLEDGAFRIDHAAALLPGGSDLALRGGLAAVGGEPRFEGAVEAESDNLRQLLAWLGVAADGVPADRLRKAVLTSQIVATPEQIAIHDLDLSLDASRVTGAATVALRRQRPGIGARLAVDQLNLDAYLPNPAEPAKAGPAHAAASAPAEPERSPPGQGKLLGLFDANFDAAVDALTWRGQAARGIRVSGTLRQGNLILREATVADLAGSSGTLTGSVDGLAGGPSDWRASVDFHGPEIARALRLAMPRLDAGDRITGPFALKGDIEGRPDAEALDLALETLGGKLRLSGEIRPGATKVEGIDLAIEASHPSFARLARSLASGYQPAGGDPGALLFAASLRGTPSRIALDDASLTIGGLTLTGSGTLDLTGKRPKLDGSFAFGDLVLDRLLPEPPTGLAANSAAPGGIRLAAASEIPVADWSRLSFLLLPLAALNADLALTGDSISYDGWRVDRPAFVLSLQDAALRVERMAGGFLGGTVDAKAALDVADSPRLSLDLAARHVDLRQVLEEAGGRAALSGRGDLVLTLTASGRDASQLIGTLAGSGTLAASAGTIAGIDLAAIGDRMKAPGRAADLLELLHSAGGGATPYETLAGSFQIRNGIVESQDLRLHAAAGDGTAALTVDLPRHALHGRVELRLAADPKAPPFVMRLDGPLDAPNTVFEVNAIERYLAQRGAVKAPAP